LARLASLRRPNRREFWAKKSIGDSVFWEKKIFNQNHMKYILYARKSTEDDDRQILSIEAQIFELKEFAAKEKLEIVKVQNFDSEFLARPASPQAA